MNGAASRSRVRQVFALSAAGLTALGVVAACQSLVGIGDDTFRVSADAASEATGADPCSPAAPPPSPDASEEGENLPTLVLAVQNTNVSGRNDAGAPIGFDIDRSCTCDTRSGVTRNQPSCVPPAKAVVANGCDYDAGIDNAFFAISGNLEKVAIASGYNDAVTRAARCGIINFLFVISRYNGLANDDEVDLSIIESHGIREPHADEDAAARCNYTGGPARPPYPARFDGTDRWSVPTKSVGRGDKGEPIPLRNLAHVWVRDYTLVLDERAKGLRSVVPIVYAGQVLEVGSPLLAAKLVPMDGAGDIPVEGGRPTRKPTSVRMAQGLFVGRATADDVLSRLGGLRIDPATAPDDEAFMCSPSKKIIYQALRSFVCSSADLMADPREDFTEKPCNALSLVVEFDARPAQIGADYDRPAPDAGCGEGFRDRCD